MHIVNGCLYYGHCLLYVINRTIYMSETREWNLINMLIMLSKKTKYLKGVLVHSLDVSINELYILYAADTHDGVLSLKALKEELELQPASLSRILGKMYDNGLIDRSFGGKDKRSIVITFTEKGKKVITNSRNLLNKILKDSSLDLKDAEDCINEVIELLHNLWALHKKGKESKCAK